MIALFQAELYLVFRQKRTYYGLAAIFLIELFIIAGSWYQGNEIIGVLLENLARSFYLEGYLLNGNLVLYIVLNSLWFNLPLIIMIIVSGFLTNDYKDRILQTIMLQSIKKVDYIIVKYCVAIAFTFMVLIFLLVSASIMAYSIFGTGDLITYLDGLNFFESDDAIKRIGMAFLSGTVLMFFYSVISISFAVLFKEITITWIACALFLILSNLLLKMDFGNMDAWFFPKLIDTWQYFFYFEIPWMDVYLNHILLLGYMLIFMIGGIFLFVKRDIG
jgi:ABC-2 type transport system permease protein